MEDHSVFPLKVIGIINSMIRPLLYSLISLDDFAQEYFEHLDIYGRIKEIEDQVQCVAEEFFELRTLTLLSAHAELRTKKRCFQERSPKRIRKTRSLWTPARVLAASMSNENSKS
jgi:hypothetical protein